MRKIPDDELSLLAPALMSVWLPGARMSDTALQSPVPWPLIGISSTRRPFRMETLTCHLFIRCPLRTNCQFPLRPFLLTLFFHSDFYNANSLIITWWVISSHLGFEDWGFIKKFLSATLPLPFSPLHAAHLQEEGFKSTKGWKRQKINVFFFFLSLNALCLFR